jgi:hypothetical protein
MRQVPRILSEQIRFLGKFTTRVYLFPRMVPSPSLSLMLERICEWGFLGEEGGGGGSVFVRATKSVLVEHIYYSWVVKCGRLVTVA